MLDNLRIPFLVGAFVLVVFMYYNRNSLMVRERYQNQPMMQQTNYQDDSTVSSESSDKPMPSKAVAPRENVAPMKGSGVMNNPVLNPNVQVNEMANYPGPFEGCFPKQRELNPEDLLPKDMNSKWAQMNPTGQGSLSDRNFIEAGHFVGINTVGQTLRNANYNLRSEIPNPQVKVSPWNQTTIDPDVGRKPLEIGSGW